MQQLSVLRLFSAGHKCPSIEREARSDNYVWRAVIADSSELMIKIFWKITFRAGDFDGLTGRRLD
jgi:hypothetical protein